jgi:hypothetical protein
MNGQKPIVGLGTNLSHGRVVTIKSNGVVLATGNGLRTFSFTEIEKMIRG